MEVLAAFQKQMAVRNADKIEAHAAPDFGEMLFSQDKILSLSTHVAPTILQDDPAGDPALIGNVEDGIETDETTARAERIIS
jgi:hypothetical protein